MTGGAAVLIEGGGTFFEPYDDHVFGIADLLDPTWRDAFVTPRLAA